MSKYIQDKLGQLWEETGSFFAFSESQFKEKINPDIRYTAMGAGLYTPSTLAKDVIKKMDAIIDTGNKKELEEKGLEKVILEALNNYECFYVSSIEDAWEDLSARDIGITRDQVLEVYRNNLEDWLEDNC